MKKVFFSLILFYFFLIVSGQKLSINGYVEDSQTGERLIGAIIFDSLSYAGSNSNSYGYFNLVVSKNQINLIISYIGYKTFRKSIYLTQDTSINIILEPKTYNLTEVIVDDKKRLIDGSRMSTTILPVSYIRQIPMLMGETDVLKSLQFLPGIQGGTEGTSGLYIRGGGPDQNLILLDGVTVYNPDHLFGFVSVFNSDAIKKVTLITGGFPAEYGGRLSSVIDIRMKEGNIKEFHGESTIGLISSKITLEGPIKDNKTAFLISARRSWIDLITRNLLKKNDLPYYYFYDLTAKVNHIFSDQSRLYLSVYTGTDHISSINTKGEYVSEGIKYVSEQNQFYGWGNITGSLRWNYIFNSRLFSNTSITYSKYKYFDNKLLNNTQTKISNGSIVKEKYKSDFNTGIRDIAVKIDFDYQAFTRNNLKFGAGWIYHVFKPYAQISSLNSGQDSTFSSSGIFEQYAAEPSFYLEDEIQLNSRIKVNAGLRLSAFLVQNKNYGSFEPRLTANYLLSDNCALKLGYSRMKQYIHLLTSSRITFPTDLWVPATDKVNPQVSDQIALGSVFNFNKNLELSIETYLKSMNGLIEYAEGSSFIDPGNWESKIEKNGKGRAYGLELMLKKNERKTTGWITYTLAKTERIFENINMGKWFPYKYDRRHDISIMVNQKITNSIDAGLTWEFTSGSLFTITTDSYESYLVGGDYNMIQYFESRNNYRMPSYHRLDLGINFHKQKKLFYRTWNISVYNVYNHKNAFFLYFDNDDIHGRKDITVFKKYTLFPILPSVTYSLKF